MKGRAMSNLFPEPIRNLPEADIPLDGIKAYLSQAKDHQLIFMEFDEDADLSEHSHAAQVGFVLGGKIELTIDGIPREYCKGDIYYIPENIKHTGKIYAGYADITFFNEPDRYGVKE
jgi:mannose-6-phosphate isomerase-like protein (cupin superfamily)